VYCAPIIVRDGPTRVIGNVQPKCVQGQRGRTYLSSAPAIFDCHACPPELTACSGCTNLMWTEGKGSRDQSQDGFPFAEDDNKMISFLSRFRPNDIFNTKRVGLSRSHDQ